MDGLTSFTVLVALTSGLVQIIKKVGIKSRWLPLLAVIIGIILVFLGGAIKIMGLSVLTGIAVGLSAMGIYDFSKKTLLGK